MTSYTFAYYVYFLDMVVALKSYIRSDKRTYFRIILRKNYHIYRRFCFTRIVLVFLAIIPYIFYSTLRKYAVIELLKFNKSSTDAGNAHLAALLHVYI